MSGVALSSRPAVAARGLNEQQRADTPWSQALPVLSAGQVVLREVRTDDAASLVSLLTVPQISRYISTPPSTTDGFEQFITAKIDGLGFGSYPNVISNVMIASTSRM